MDVTLKAWSVPLLILVLSVHLCSAAPIPAEVFPLSEAAPEADGQHEEGNVAPSPEESLPQQHILVITEEPQPALVEDQVSAEADESIAAAPQETSEEETDPEQVVVESEQEHLEDPDPETSVVHSDAPEEKKDNPVAVESVAENPEQQDLEDPAATQSEAPEENTEEEVDPEEPLLIVPDDNTDEEHASFPVPEEEESVSGPAVIVSVEPAEEQEETISSISSETKDEADEDGAVLGENPEVNLPPDELSPPSMLEPEESVDPFPVEPENQNEGEVEAAEQAESDPDVIVPLDPTEEEMLLKEEVLEESNLTVSPVAPEDNTEGEAAEVPEGNEEEETAVNEGALSAPEEEESVVTEAEEEGGEETAPALNEHAVIVPAEPSSESPAPDHLVLTVPLDGAEDTPENNTITEEEVVQSDLGSETALEEDTAASVPESQAEDTTDPALDPGEEVPEISPPAAVPESHSVLLEGGEGISMKTHMETHMETHMKTHRGDVKAAPVLTEEEPEAPVNRGLILSSAFFTLMSFIIIGFVGMTVAKKLR